MVEVRLHRPAAALQTVRARHGAVDAPRGRAAPPSGSAAEVTAPSPRSASRQRRRLTGRAPRGTRRALAGRTFVEVFSGCGALGRAVARHGLQVVQWDVVHGSSYNLCVSTNLKRLIKRIRKQDVCAVHLGTPCTTFSNARRPMIRSATCPRGLPDLSPKASQQVHDGNLLADATARLLRECIARGLAVTLENPQTSLLWKYPPIAKLISQHQLDLVNFHMCQYGTTWKKGYDAWDFWVSVGVAA